ncbi:MAG TPA: PqqD family protein [Kribbella sp.]|nr:PqqD family protein [Kribbella sp.]
MAMPDVDRTRIADQRDEAFLALRAAMPPANLEAASRCCDRLLDELPHREQLDRNLVLVAYGGGKDSSYTLAFVRAMQLILFRVHGTTFRLRVATNRHAGMPRAVMENIDRAYRGLRLSEDPDCELLLIDGNEVTTFDVDAPQREHVVRRNRLDILMTGHRTLADGRPTFCNACNLSVVNSFGLAASFGGGADLIITGDSQQEQRQYTAWVGRLARRLDPTARPADGNGIGRLLSQVDGIAQSYFADIHGPDAAEAIAERRVAAGVPEQLRFFSIYSDTEYAAGAHMELLTGLLGFQFDDIAFNFTESDCGNPALMAHLRGLKCDRVYQRSYAEGVGEYVEFALGLMRKKDIPADLIELMRSRYEGPDAVARMRRAANEYALETFGLTETQLICMAYSPFADKGTGLEDYLEREHPVLAARTGDIHAMLTDESVYDSLLADDLEHISGLEPPQLRVLYRSSTQRSGGTGTGVIDIVLAGDPHKAVIRTQHTRNGPNTFEQISGR